MQTTHKTTKLRRVLMELLIAIAAFLLVTWSVPHRWCSRGARRWFSGDVDLEQRFKRGIEQWIRSACEFSTRWFSLMNIVPVILGSGNNAPLPAIVLAILFVGLRLLTVLILPGVFAVWLGTLVWLHFLESLPRKSTSNEYLDL